MNSITITCLECGHKDKYMAEDTPVFCESCGFSFNEDEEEMWEEDSEEG